MSQPPEDRALQRPIRVTLLNDYEIVVRGLHQMLEPFGDLVEVVETEVGGVPDRPTDIALFDTFAGRRQALARIAEMTADDGIDKIVVYTWDLPAGFGADLDAVEVDGVIMKTESAPQLVDALVRIHRGERVRPEHKGSGSGLSALTEREREVLALLARGLSNPQIAEELYLSADTVKTHVRKLFAKLGVGNRTQAALIANDHGLTLPMSSPPARAS